MFQFFKFSNFKISGVPAFAFDFMLKFTSVKLDLLDNVPDYLFLEDSIKGGLR